MTVSESLSRLDAGWLGEALDAPVTDLRVEPVAFTGATTDMARLHVTYADAADGPATMIAKIRGVKDVQVQMDGAMGLFGREARFYTEFAGQVPVRAPQCYFVGDGDATPLLLEDVGTMRMGDQMDGLAVADAQTMMDTLGDLHGTFWESPALSAEWLSAPAEGIFAAMIGQLVASGAPALAERYAGQVSDAVIAAVVAAAPDWGQILTTGAAGPPTLVHNDCRLDNLFFAADGTPVFIDWQVCARTRGTQDVGNLLAGSMNSDDLAANWEALVGRYHARLVERGVSNYSLAQCTEHYRQSILYPLGAGMALIGMMDIGDGRGLGDAITLRCLKHIEALDSFAVV